MSTFLEMLNSGADHVSPLDLAVRLCLALILGVLISTLYRFTRTQSETSSFPTTLVLLTIMIAMVTKVIGDNVARAFSLVGALSIVRFRTVVRDTEDTAYVIFAVVIGMALGANHLWVAAIGITVVGLAAFLLKNREKKIVADPSHTLTVRVGIGHDVDAVVTDTFKAYATEWRIQSVSTSKQGLAIDVTYHLSVREPDQAEAFIKALNRLEGIQCVELTRCNISGGSK
jgi:uncharacterized membrane protein YhiD involved in acid resistance